MSEKFIMVRESTYQKMREALTKCAEGWGNAVEFDLLPPRHHATATYLRDEARAALAKSEATHPAPDGCDQEGKHQWGGPERNREVCVNCGATRVLEGGSAGEPVAWWVHDLHVARQPVKARARYPEPTEFLYPASREQDARNAAKMLGGKCTPLFAHPALTAGKPEQEGR